MHRGRGYEKILSFPQIVQLIGDALLQNNGSAYRVFRLAQESGSLEVSMPAIYGKLSRLSITLSQAFLVDRTDPLRAIFPPGVRRLPPRSLRMFLTMILDGKAIKNVAKRLTPLREAKGVLLGGRALAAMDYGTGMTLAMHTDADGDTNECRFVPNLLPVVQKRFTKPLLWMADRGFCDLNRLEDFSKNGNHFLVRFYPKNGFHLDPCRKVLKSKDVEGRRFIQEWGWLSAETHKKRRYVRRITLFRPGEESVIVVTDLLSYTTYPAKDLLAHYSERGGD